jgi:hypothetical protein
MNLPIQLIPTKTKLVSLPSVGTVTLPVCPPVFLRWSGTPPDFDFGQKPIVDDGGKPVFAELALLNLLRSSGWDGVWVSAFAGTHFLREMPSDWKLASHHVAIPKEKEDVLRRIWKAAGTNACFDVFAWNDSDILLCEGKQVDEDFTEGQYKFIQGALPCEVRSDSLLIAEWSFNERV